MAAICCSNPLSQYQFLILMYCVTVYFVTIFACFFGIKQLYLNLKPSFSFLKRLFFIQQISSIVPSHGKWLSMFVHTQTSQVQFNTWGIFLFGLQMFSIGIYSELIFSVILKQCSTLLIVKQSTLSSSSVDTHSKYKLDRYSGTVMLFAVCKS